MKAAPRYICRLCGKAYHSYSEAENCLEPDLKELQSNHDKSKFHLKPKKND